MSVVKSMSRIKQQAGNNRLTTRVPVLPVERSTAHQGSKRWYSHRPDPRPDNRLAQAAIWSHVTGRPLPPHVRTRPDQLSQPVPMKLSKRPVRTTAQRQRARHKTGTRMAATKPSSATYDQLRVTYLALRPDGYVLR